jgi:hypothetical protein
MDLLSKELLPPISYQTKQTRTQEKHGGGFGDGYVSYRNVISLECVLRTSHLEAIEIGKVKVVHI